MTTMLDRFGFNVVYARHCGYYRSLRSMAYGVFVGKHGDTRALHVLNRLPGAHSSIPELLRHNVRDSAQTLIARLEYSRREPVIVHSGERPRKEENRCRPTIRNEAGVNVLCGVGHPSASHKFDGLTSQQFKIAALTSTTAISLRSLN